MKKGRKTELLRLFLSFGKVGTFIFGGGYAMLPALRHEILTIRGWATEAELLDLVAVSQALPGAFAINLAAMVGRRRAGLAGALAASAGMIVPAFFAILLLAAILRPHQDNPYVAGALTGIKAVSVALIGVTIWQIGRTVLRKPVHWLVAVAAFGLIIFWKMNAIWVVLGGALVGLAESRWRRRKEPI